MSTVINEEKKGKVASLFEKLIVLNEHSLSCISSEPSVDSSYTTMENHLPEKTFKQEKFVQNLPNRKSISESLQEMSVEKYSNSSNKIEIDIPIIASNYNENSKYITVNANNLFRKLLDVHNLTDPSQDDHDSLICANKVETENFQKLSDVHNYLDLVGNILGSTSCESLNTNQTAECYQRDVETIFDKLSAKDFSKYPKSEKHNRARPISSENRLLVNQYNIKEYRNISLLAKESDNVATDINNLLKEISSNQSLQVEIKLTLLKNVSQICSEEPNLCKKLSLTSLACFTESLLEIYCDHLSLRTNNKHENLSLIIPSMEVLSLSSHIPVKTVRSVFLYQSELLPKLMHAFSLSVNLPITAFNKIHGYKSSKELVACGVKLDKSEVKSAFENSYGLHIDFKNFCLVGYKITLFDTSAENDVNINEQLMNLWKPFKLNYCLNEPNSDKCESAENAEWFEVTIAQVLPIKYVLAYTQSNWKEIIVTISNNICQQIEEQKKNEQLTPNLKIGEIIGFKTKDAVFNSSPLVNVLYLRGQIISIHEQDVLLWAIDVGSTCQISKEHVFSVIDTLNDKYPSLIKLCILTGSICELDEKFVITAIKLLRIILESNIHTGKHMILCEYGESILSLLEYPQAKVRTEVLNLLLLLTSNSEVCQYLGIHHFDDKLAERIQYFALGYQIIPNPRRNIYRTELCSMLKLLLAILEGKSGLKEWSNNKQSLKAAISVLLGDPTIPWRKLCEKILHQLGSKPMNMKEDFVRRTTDFKKEKGQRFHAFCLPRNNILCDKSSLEVNSCFQSIIHEFEEDNEEIILDESEEAKQITAHTDYFIYKSKVDIKCNQVHHLMEEVRLYHLKEVQLAQILCGLLNNNVESSMYFGISRDSVVVGMLLNREDKDVFRNGIDRIMSKCLLPEVRANCYDVIFIPVIRCDEVSMELYKHSLYVIEIKVRPLMHMAYVIYQGRRCYMRQDTDTVEWTVMQKKNYMMELEEKLLEESITVLNKTSEGYLQELRKFIENQLQSI